MAALADDLVSGIASQPYDLKNFHHANNDPAPEKLIAVFHHGTSTGKAHFLVSNYGERWGCGPSTKPIPQR